MIKNSAKQTVQEFFNLAGIKINGEKPYDIKVHNEKFYSRLLSGGSLAMGESYMDGWWDVEKLDEFFFKLLSVKLDKKVITPRHFISIVNSKIFNMQTLSKSKEVAELHYDLNNDFYEKMLDKQMQYTCGYWKNAKNLDEAQEHKLDLVCKKLQLKPGEKVLELGCGWGGFSKYAAEKYGCHVTAYNISKEQIKYGREKCKDLPVEIIEKDYRLAKGTFDKVVSIGLCEHVGYKNYKSLMKLVHKCLKKNGLFLIHTIGKDISVTSINPWINKYIFPNSMLPSLTQISRAAERLFIMEDWHNFGADYDKTLMEWFKNFDKNWHLFKDEYGERFYRMWKFYLLSCAGLFRARQAQLWQIVFSKDGFPNGYESIR